MGNSNTKQFFIGVLFVYSALVLLSAVSTVAGGVGAIIMSSAGWSSGDLVFRGLTVFISLAVAVGCFVLLRYCIANRGGVYMYLGIAAALVIPVLAVGACLLAFPLSMG